MAKINLTITASEDIKHDLGYYVGKSCKAVIHITDDTNQKYETELSMQPGWCDNDFRDAMTMSFCLCEGIPTAVHLHSINFIN